MGEKKSDPMPELIRKTGRGELRFTAPPREGAYRVFVFATGEGDERRPTSLSL
jgi:hypothetical protein